MGAIDLALGLGVLELSKGVGGLEWSDGITREGLGLLSPSWNDSSLV